MIGMLNGILQDKEPEQLIIEAAGVGYLVKVSGRTHDQLPSLGESVRLWIHTAVREDAITLFGFKGREEKEIFLLLNTVSGIGPKLALAILGGITVPDLIAAVTGRDINRLTTLSGVGKKTAQRLCVELIDKLTGPKAEKAGFEALPQPLSALPTAGDTPDQLHDTASALSNLGYPPPTIRRALELVCKTHGEAVHQLPLEQLIREALQALARVA